MTIVLVTVLHMLLSHPVQRKRLSFHVSVCVSGVQLMFSNPLDPPSVTAARSLERQHMHKWVEEAASGYRTQAKQ